MFSALWRYMRAFGYMITGRFNKASESLAENEYVMAATYDASISKSKSRYQTTKTALAELISLEKEIVATMKGDGEKLERHQAIKFGAQASMQQIIDKLRAAGKSKEDIMADPAFIESKGSFESASTKLEEAQKSYDKKEEVLKTRRAAIAKQKTALQSMQRTAQDLEAEKQEALADVAVARQQEAVNNVLNGMSVDTTDQELEKTRKARNRVVARADISSEIAGVDANSTDEKFIAMASQSKASKELDSLLNWGEEKKEELAPATIPEN